MRPKCLVCGATTPWHQKLFFNILNGLPCLKCNSIMKHSLSTNIISFVIMALTILLASQVYGSDYWYFYAAACAASFIWLVIYIYKAKLMLIFKNGRFVNNV